MKKLAKLCLSPRTKILSENEMMHLRGGYEENEDIPPEVKACMGKSEGGSCQWIYQGRPVYGKCVSAHFTYDKLYCSDLN